MSSLLVRYSKTTPTTIDPSYWIRVEQTVEEPLTGAEAAELTDELYSIDPCIEEPPAPEPISEEEVTEEDIVQAEEAEADPNQEKLYQTAMDVFGEDIETCQSDLVGDYTTTARVYRSHLNEQYILELSSGEVISSVPTYEKKDLTLIAENAYYIELDYPITKSIKLSWRGTVKDTSGPISPPELKVEGTTVYWDSYASGTIIASFTTQYDLLTIDVPGTPTEEGSLIGTSEDITILALYHFMAFDFILEAPEPDHSLAKGALLQLCGYAQQGELRGAVDGTDPYRWPEEPVNYGCLDYSDLWGSAAWYKIYCCKEGTGDGCLVNKSGPNPGGQTMTEEEKAKYRKGRGIGPSMIVDPITEFIPATPNTAEGCGAIYINAWREQNNCCNDVEDLAIDTDNTSDVLPQGENITIYVTGGLNIKTFTTSANGTHFSNRKKSISVNADYAVLYANDSFCGNTSVSVDDGCSKATIIIRSDEGEWGPVTPGLCVLLGTPIQWVLNVSGNNFIGHAISGKYIQFSVMTRAASDEGQSYRDANLGHTPKGYLPYPGDNPCDFDCFGSGAGYGDICDCIKFDMSLANLCLVGSEVTAAIYETNSVYTCSSGKNRSWIQLGGTGNSWRCLGNSGFGAEYNMYWYDASSHYAQEWRCAT